MVEKLRAKRDYEGALLEIAKLRPAIDKFFDKVWSWWTTPISAQIAWPCCRPW